MLEKEIKIQIGILVDMYKKGIITEYQAASDLLYLVQNENIDINELFLDLPEDILKEIKEQIARR